MLNAPNRTAIGHTGYGLLLLLGLLVFLTVSTYLRSPGYMDADYYYVTGKQLASGKGFSEPFLWNYLDDPTGLPHPSHLYWMPLAGILAGVGIWIREAIASPAFSSVFAQSPPVWNGMESFSAARAVFLFLAACLPPATAALAYSFSGNHRHAWMAGLLALFPGFYLPFLTTTDTFGIYMLLGMLYLQACSQLIFRASAGRLEAIRFLLWCLLLGALAGLMHLARADGVLWIVVGMAAIWMAFKRSPDTPASGGLKRVIHRLGSLTALVLGYLVIISPWIARNLSLAGSLSAPGASRALWITRYDELFTYPSSLLTPARWWASGLEDIVRGRLWAGGQNLQTAAAVQGELFLVPLILAGMWLMRADPRVRLGGFAWGLTFLVMTLFFPFQGARGGWFHSGAALQPLFWALAPIGLARMVQWGQLRRGWVAGQAGVVFGAGAVGLAVFVTLLTALPRLYGSGSANHSWGQAQAMYIHLESALQEAGAPPDASVLVNNPPGYFGATGRSSLVIPDGDESTILAVARRYQGSYLLLEQNHPRALESLYRNPGDRPGLEYLLTVDDAHIYSIESE